MKIYEQTEIRSLCGNVEKVFLVDASWLLNKSFFGYAENFSIVTVEGLQIETGDIHGFLIGLLMIIRRCPTSSIILCLDSRENDRKAECPEYKADREHKDYIWEKLYEILQSASMFPNVYISAYRGMEGDDIIHSLCQKFYGKVNEILIYGRDKDLMQNIRDSIFMYEKCEGKNFIRRGIPEVKEIFGCEPQNTPLVRSICGGDRSDGLVSGYSRFPKKLAVRIADLYGDPNKFLASDYWGDQDSHKRWIEMLRHNPGPMFRLYGLMKSRFIPNLPIYRCESSYRFIDYYKLSQVDRDFKRFLLFGERQYSTLRISQ